MFSPSAQNPLPYCLVSLACLVGPVGPVGVVAAQEPASPASRLTLEQVSGRGNAPSFAARAGSVRWAHDGYHILVGRGDDERWLDPQTLEEAEPVPKLTPGAGPDTPPSISPSQLRKHLREEYPDLELLELCKDKSVAGFVQGGDLYVHHLAKDKTIQLTHTGSPEFFNGKLDWVYQEEVYGRGRFKGSWLSPTGKYIAFLALDESAVHSFTLVDHIEDGHNRVLPEVVNYPKAGDPNPTTALGIANTATGRVRWVDLGAYDGAEPLVVRVGWNPDGRCYYMVQDRIQTLCDLHFVDPANGKDTLLIQESSQTWVNRPPAPRWLDENQFIWESERTGYNHLYLYSARGKLKQVLTQGPWAVTGITHLDVDADLLEFTSTEGGAINRNTYRTNLSGGPASRLTVGPGHHSLSFNADRSLFLDRVSSLEAPEEVRLCSSADGELIEILAAADIPTSGGAELARWKLHEIPAQDGTPLDVAVMLPTPMDEGRTYPVVIDTYSGPNSPTIRNRWNSSAWDQFRAQQGVILLRVNVRTASGKGQWAIGQCYKQLGVLELNDLIAVIDWLCANPWADGDRVGISGYSYGGFMAAYALLASDRFALGIAGGGVYDWRLYDTIYTERYMSTPHANPEGYEKTSCLERAGDLHGFLHMHHGVMDDNVHFQNMMKMAYALQRAGQTDWSMMAYPQARHGIRDGEQRWHARQAEWSLIRQHLISGNAELAGSRR